MPEINDLKVGTQIKAVRGGEEVTVTIREISVHKTPFFAVDAFGPWTTIVAYTTDPFEPSHPDVDNFTHRRLDEFVKAFLTEQK